MKVYTVTQSGKGCQTRMAVIFDDTDRTLGAGRDIRIVGRMKPMMVPKGIPVRRPSGIARSRGVRAFADVISGEVKRYSVR